MSGRRTGRKRSLFERKFGVFSPNPEPRPLDTHHDAENNEDRLILLDAFNACFFSEPSSMQSIVFKRITPPLLPKRSLSQAARLSKRLFFSRETTRHLGALQLQSMRTHSTSLLALSASATEAFVAPHSALSKHVQLFSTLSPDKISKSNSEHLVPAPDHPPLPATSLRWHLDPSTFNFTTTDDLTPLENGGALLNQARARSAIEFGVHMKRDGYNLFVLGDRKSVV